VLAAAALAEQRVPPSAPPWEQLWVQRVQQVPPAADLPVELERKPQSRAMR
jgi:hypothetical protein